MTQAANKVALYGADSGDYTAALAIAGSLQIPTTNVTGDFNTAAHWVADGTYLVIAVGSQADTALYWNPCGWSTTAYSMSTYPACHTPFGYYSFPYDGAISTDTYLSAAGSSGYASYLAGLFLAHFAINGNYPNYALSLPHITDRRGQTCASSDCAGNSTNSCPSTS